MADTKQNIPAGKHEVLVQKLVDKIFSPRAIPVTKSPYDYYAKLMYNKQEIEQMIRELLASEMEKECEQTVPGVSQF